MINKQNLFYIYVYKHNIWTCIYTHKYTYAYNFKKFIKLCIFNYNPSQIPIQ